MRHALHQIMYRRLVIISTAWPAASITLISCAICATRCQIATNMHHSNLTKHYVDHLFVENILAGLTVAHRSDPPNST